jgi:type VI secretion system protein ImpK
MHEAVTALVYPVIGSCLALKGRLERGERPDFATEQGTLRGLLLTEVESRRWADYGGDEAGAGPGADADAGRRPAEPGPRTDRFLGIRYALVCWLDEVFVLDSPWSRQWNEHKLEVELYGTNDRAWKFWEQARRAEVRASPDALEVFYLCVMLGFAGDLRDQPDRLQAWAASARGRVGLVRDLEWPFAAEVEPATNVPPLYGREKLRRMVLSGGLVLLLLVPVLVFFVVRQLGQ